MYRDDTLRKSFWARGNGWVIAGAVRVLQYLPSDDPKRADFVKLLTTMSSSLKAAQGADGLWRANLLEPSAAGKLGYVQPVGAGPAAATADSTVEYGVSAYLLAGSEVAKLLP
jgi:hypothetical protein